MYKFLTIGTHALLLSACGAIPTPPLSGLQYIDSKGGNICPSRIDQVDEIEARDERLACLDNNFELGNLVRALDADPE